MITITQTKLNEVHKKHQLFIAVHTRARWLKPGQPADQKHLTPTLLMGGLRAMLAKLASLYYKAQFFLRVCVCVYLFVF